MLQGTPKKRSDSYVLPSIKNARPPKAAVRGETMASELRSSAHTVGETNLHLQFTPAYRRDIFADELVRELTIAYVLQRAKELHVNIAAIECGKDHMHLFITNWKNYAVSTLAGLLKSYSARMMNKGHKALFENKLWGGRFWSAGYFHRTVGAVNSETVQRYITEGQKKHWTTPEHNQATLLHYAA